MKSLFFFKKQAGSSHKLLTFGKHVSDKGKASERREQAMISRDQPKTKSSGRAPKARADSNRAYLLQGKDVHSFQRPEWDSSSPPSHYRSTGSLSFPKPSWFHSSESLLPSENHTKHKLTTGSAEKKLNQPSPPLFIKGSSSTSHLPVAEQCSSRLYQRRGSEPGRQVIDRSSGTTRARLPSDPGLKGTEVQTEARFCLSPCATKAVRDYFCTYPYSNPHSGQQVALALVESRRQWLKRCNDPTAEPDFEQLLFAEESYV